MPDTLVSLESTSFKGATFAINYSAGIYYFFPNMESIEKMGPGLRESIRKSDKYLIIIEISDFDKRKIDKKILIEVMRNKFENDNCHFYHWSSCDILCPYTMRHANYNMMINLRDKESTQNDTVLNQEISKIIQKLKPYTLKNEYQKIGAAYDYVRQNVVYDYRFGKHCGTAYGAAAEKKAICSGFAALVLRLLCELGIPARVISINPKETEKGHDANIVKLGEKWYMLDATGASAQPDREREYDPFFLSDLKTYIQLVGWDDPEIRVVGDIDFKDTDDLIPFLRLDDPEALVRYPMSQHRYQEEIVN